jgi:GAF domain
MTENKMDDSTRVSVLGQLLRKNSSKKMIGRLVREASQELEVDSVVLWSITDDDQWVDSQISAPKGKLSQANIRHETANSVFGMVEATGFSILLGQDDSGDLDLMGGTSLALVPVFYTDEIIGMLSAGRLDSSVPISDADLERLEWKAALISTVLMAEYDG